MTSHVSSVDDKYKLITKDLEEVIQEENGIVNILQHRDLRIHWGISITGKPHVGYLVPLAKIVNCLRAGCEVHIVLADLHGYIDGKSVEWGCLKNRTGYYGIAIGAMLESTGVSLENLQFSIGSDWQHEEQYWKDVLSVANVTSINRATKATSSSVRDATKDGTSSVGSLMYPCLQATDEVHLGTDAQLGGTDQRKLFVLAREKLPKVGLHGCSVHLMNPILPGLRNEHRAKMSSSGDEQCKINLCDEPDVVSKKVHKTYCERGEVKDNWVLSAAKLIIFPLLEHGHSITVQRDGNDLPHVHGYEELERMFLNNEIEPRELKALVANELNRILDPIRNELKDLTWV